MNVTDYPWQYVASGNLATLGDGDHVQHGLEEVVVSVQVVDFLYVREGDSKSKSQQILYQVDVRFYRGFSLQHGHYKRDRHLLDVLNGFGGDVTLQQQSEMSMEDSLKGHVQLVEQQLSSDNISSTT
jgi:hypothetical protein